MDFELVAHPDFPAPREAAVEVGLARSAGETLALCYRARAEGVAWPALAAPERADDLWRATCFELFLALPGDAYLEFNFSPSRRWAAYRFARYREGRCDLALPTPPRVERVEGGVEARLDLGGVEGLSAGPWRAALTAVLAFEDGRSTYWALRHPEGAPNFHHRDGFAAEVPASI